MCVCVFNRKQSGGGQQPEHSKAAGVPFREARRHVACGCSGKHAPVCSHPWLPLPAAAHPPHLLQHADELRVKGVLAVPGSARQLLGGLQLVQHVDLGRVQREAKGGKGRQREAKGGSARRNVNTQADVQQLLHSR